MPAHPALDVGREDPLRAAISSCTTLGFVVCGLGGREAVAISAGLLSEVQRVQSAISGEPAKRFVYSPHQGRALTIGLIHDPPLHARGVHEPRTPGRGAAKAALQPQVSVTTMGGATASLVGQFPDFFNDADRASLEGQRRYTRGVRSQLVALLAAAICGAFTWRYDGSGADWFGVAAAAAFAAAVFQRTYIWQTRPDQEWYGGRAAAESAKTLSYRFAFCADPFPRGMTELDATTTFLQRLQDVRRELGEVTVVPQPGGMGEITSGMTALREETLEVRKAVYLSERIINQRDWYSRKAAANKTQARRWLILMIAVEFAGFVGAILKASNVLSIDLLGFASAVVAASAAWMEMRQHNNLATAYSVAARELSAAHEQGRRIENEQSWSAFVANAEEAISREHTMWAASRGR